MGKKLTVDLPDEIYDALQSIAHRRSDNLADALTKAIATTKFIDDKQFEGSKILVDQDGELREVNFK